MNDLMPILLVLVLVICYCSLNNSNKNKKNSNSMLNNNNLVVCLLLVGAVLFFIMVDMDKKQENYLGYYPYTNPQNIPKCNRLRNNKKKYPLLKNVIHVSPDGSESKLTQDMMSHHYPHVDANQNSPQHLFMYARNQSSPHCCPSIHSDSRGCICQTDSQTQLFKNQ